MEIDLRDNACAIRDCMIKGDCTGIQYFKFPDDDFIKKQWIDVCDKQKLISTNEPVICSYHFEKSTYLLALCDEPRRMYLKKDAIPTLNLPKITNVLSRVQSPMNTDDPKSIQSSYSEWKKVTRIKTGSKRRESVKISRHMFEWNCASKEQNPIYDLIKNIPDGIINEHTFSEINRNVFRNILKFFIVYYSSETKPLDTVAINCEFDTNCLIEMLKMWKGWTEYENIKQNFTKAIYSELYYYIQGNIANILKFKNDRLRKFPVENVIKASCSLKQLSTLFHNEPNRHKIFYRLDEPSPVPMNYFPHHIFNWPYVSTHIDLPGFSMIHENSNVDEFILLNLLNVPAEEEIQDQLTDLFHESPIDSAEFRSDFVVNFLYQLLAAIYDEDDEFISSKRKKEIMKLFYELEKDLELCFDTIETNTNYHMYLNSFPYVRYFGNVPKYRKKDDRSESLPMDVRLKQICYPRISFNLKKFDITYEFEDGDISFNFDKTFLEKVNTCILYRCNLCQINLSTYSTAKSIFDHYSDFHNIDAGWKCVVCARYYRTNFLAQNRWKHDCLQLSD